MTKRFRNPLIFIICLIMAFSVLVPAFGATPANDYDSHWAKAVIQSAIDSGISKGYPDGSFRPDKAVTRAEFFALVNNAFKFTKTSAVEFSDVTADAWYAPVIAQAKAAGYISGYADGGIHPESNITRQEAAVIISRIKSLAGPADSLSFTDTAAIASWSKPAVSAVFAAKVMSGYPDGSFKPQAQIKRAEALVAVNNGLNYQAAADTIYDQAGTYGSLAETTTIPGNVVIKAAGITLQNTIIKGSLTIAREVGNGEATLKNVTVLGDTYVYGGGVNSIYFIDVTSGKVYVQKDDGPVRIVASGASAIERIMAGSDVKLAEVNLTGAGFAGITVEKNAAGGIDITLAGVKCDSVDIQAAGVTLNCDQASTIANLTVNAAGTKITGKGVISSAEINADGVSFESKPVNLIVASGIADPTITPALVSSGGGGGGRVVVPDTSRFSVTLAKSIENPVGKVINVAIPAAGGTDETGKISGWEAADPDDIFGNSANQITLTVTDVSTASSAITIDGAPYISGDDYVIAAAEPLTIVVTTSETGKAAEVRTFIVDVTARDSSDHSYMTAYSDNDTPAIGEPFNLLIDYASGMDNSQLSGDIAVKISSDDSEEGVAGVVYDHTATFVDGSSSIEIALQKSATQTLTVEVAGISDTGTVTVTVVTKVGDWSYSLTGRGVEIAKYYGSGGAVSIPGTWNRHAVTSIGDNAFNDVDDAEPHGQDITSITIPRTVTSIGVEAFKGCSGLTRLTIPANVTSIGDGAFTDCTELTRIVIPDKVTEIAWNTFSGCQSLSSVTIGSGVKTIGSSAFNGCYAMTSITIPASVEMIEDNAFYGNMEAICFDGDAPDLEDGADPFNGNPTVAIYYHHDAAGFTSPLWHGYITDEMVEGTPGAWLNLNRDYFDQLLNVTAEMEYSLDGGDSWSECGGTVVSLPRENISAADDVLVRMIDSPQMVQTIDVTEALPTPVFGVIWGRSYDCAVTGLLPHTNYYLGIFDDDGSGIEGPYFSDDNGIIDGLNISSGESVMVRQSGLHAVWSIKGIRVAALDSLAVAANSQAEIDLSLAEGTASTITVTLNDADNEPLADADEGFIIKLTIDGYDDTYYVNGKQVSSTREWNQVMRTDGLGQYTFDVAIPDEIMPGGGISIQVQDANGNDIGDAFAIAGPPSADTGVYDIRVLGEYAQYDYDLEDVYNIELPGTTVLADLASTDFEVRTNDDGATAVVTTNDGGATWEVVVTAQDGITQETYTVNVTLAAEDI